VVSYAIADIMMIDESMPQPDQLLQDIQTHRLERDQQDEFSCDDDHIARVTLDFESSIEF